MRPFAPLLALALLVACSPPGRADHDGPPPRVEALTTASEAPVRALAAPEPPAASAEAPGGDGACPAGYRCDPGALDRAPRPAITELFIQKRAHLLHLVAGNVIVKSYGVALGSGGLGQKRVEGDRVTPIGTYSITGRYPSRWHTYLALSYPNDEDRARFDDLAARGEVDRKLGPGSAIAIHGRRADMRDRHHKLLDWTLGCVALDNDEIDEVAALAPVGTRVVIRE
ncbi:MAG: L,D-transpeptidase [Polyangiaceae bacterium]|nr:L,D-transpeptidase [Polyangiaceae bacterium]